MVDLYVNIIYTLTSLLSCLSLTTGTDNSGAYNKQPDILHHLDKVGKDLSILSRSIRSAHADITARQLEECQVMGPISDTICDLLFMDKALGENEAVDKAIHNSLAPGKRSGPVPLTDMAERKSFLEDLLQKQRFLESLNSVIDLAQNRITTERKRSCNLNLGFHCQAEHYSAIADMYNWLQSSLSPGRRKRRAVLKQSDDKMNPDDTVYKD